MKKPNLKCPKGHLKTGTNLVWSTQRLRSGKKVKYRKCRTCRNHLSLLTMRKVRKTRMPRPPAPKTIDIAKLDDAIEAVKEVTKRTDASKELVAWVSGQILTCVAISATIPEPR